MAVTPAHAFVTYPDGYRTGTGLISVLDLHGSAAKVIRTVQVPGEPFGAALSANDQYLLVANYLGGLEILSTAAPESGRGQVVVTQLASTGLGPDEIVLSPDGSYAFVPEEESSAVAVYDLGGLLTRARGTQQHQTGSVPVGEAPSGAVLAPDGETLYVVSQTAGNSAAQSPGLLDAISVKVAELDPARAVLERVDAGCDPCASPSPHQGLPPGSPTEAVTPCWPSP